MSEQKKIDDLFEKITSENASASEAASSAQAPQASSSYRAPPSEAPIQSKASGTGVWGSRKDPLFFKVSDALEDRLVEMQKRMRINEDLMMTYLFREGINEAYYRLWRTDANSFFRSVIAAKHRLKAEREREDKSNSQ